MRHAPVLLSEVIDSLQLKPGMNVVDCTLGDAGHSEAMLEQTSPDGRLLGLDADPESLLRAKQYLYRFGGRAVFIRDNFVHLQEIVVRERFSPVNAVLMDLGWSSPQFAERGRGFSFEKNEPLDMRYNGPAQSLGEAGKTAAEILNTYSQKELELIFKQYGEEKLAKEIAAAAVARREAAPFKTTSELAEIILAVYRERLRSTKETPWIGGIHPATKVFQALRIAVNRELDVLKETLPQAVSVLAPGGRLAVIAFHSLEDRVVKHFFQAEENKILKIITKKPVIASGGEITNNPRARSARLRVIEKLGS